MLFLNHICQGYFTILKYIQTVGNTWLHRGRTRNNNVGFKISFVYQNRIFTIYHSKGCCTQYIEDGSRLWIIEPPKWRAKQIQR